MIKKKREIQKLSQLRTKEIIKYISVEYLAQKTIVQFVGSSFRVFSRFIISRQHTKDTCSLILLIYELRNTCLF